MEKTNFLKGNNKMEEDLNLIYKKRCEKLSSFLKEKNIFAAIFDDSEDNRDSSLRYLSGHPSDALLIVLDSGKSFLFPWDENLASIKAHADEIIPLTKFKCNKVSAAEETLKSFNLPENSVISLSPKTPFFKYKQYSEHLSPLKVSAEENLAQDFVTLMRSQKDSYEISCTKEACKITDLMTEEIKRRLEKGEIKTEADVALFAEKELRLKGAEKTSFDTLAAGPERSYAIHAFPGYTGGLWGNEGLSILDYGVSYEGYASDCTITIAKGKLSSEQEKLLSLVQKVADECVFLYGPNKKIFDAVKRCDDIFMAEGKSMPHGLGHGIGLEIHEEPFVSLRSGKEKTFKTGNIVTLEPGLYDMKTGGVRLENDILITENGNEVLTHSAIFRL